MFSMRVLGIDPGPKESAFCFWHGDRIGMARKTENEEVLSIITGIVVPGIKVAVEHMQSFGMGVGKEVFETCYWIGEFRHACKCHSDPVPFIPVTRMEVKQHFCHSARATDSNIRYALEDRFGPKGTKKNPGLLYPLVGSDMRSAFAIAVMVYDRESHPQPEERLWSHPHII